jgi:hypothetical protein
MRSEETFLNSGLTVPWSALAAAPQVLILAVMLVKKIRPSRSMTG